MRSAPTVDQPPLDHAASVFDRLRPRLFGIAYRVLGSAAEAADVVQDAWLRWQSTDRSVVRDPHAFLVTTATWVRWRAPSPSRSAATRMVADWYARG
jgi:RNA polymerase sigma-70 factor (ECF subfamily)